MASDDGVDLTELYLRYVRTYFEIPTFDQFQAFAKKEDVKVAYKDAKNIINNPPNIPESLENEIQLRRQQHKASVHKASDTDYIHTERESKILNQLHSGHLTDLKTKFESKSQKSDDDTANTTNTTNNKNNDNTNNTDNNTNQTQNESNQSQNSNENNENNENNEQTQPNNSNINNNNENAINGDTNIDNNNNNGNDSSNKLDNNDPTAVANANANDSKTEETKNNNDLTDDTLASFQAQIMAQKELEIKENELNNDNNNNNKKTSDVSNPESSYHSFKNSVASQASTGSSEESDDLHIRSLSNVSMVSETPDAPPTPSLYGAPPALGSVPKGNSILQKFQVGGNLPPKPQYVPNDVLNTKDASLPVSQTAAESMQTVLCHEEDETSFTEHTASTWVDSQMD